MEQNGHQSVEGIQHYERNSALQEVSVCRALDTKTDFQGQLALPNPSPESTPVLPQPPFSWPVPLPGNEQAALQSFQVCTFSNCTFQISSSHSNADVFADINIQDFLAT